MSSLTDFVSNRTAARRIMMAKSFLFLSRAAARLLSGAIAYYACEMLCDYLAFRDGGNAQVARASQLILFPLLAIVAFVFLAVGWQKVPPSQPGTHYPEVFMIVGATIFMPLYFELASYLIYNPRPIVLSEVRKDVLWMYALFPLTVIDTGTYTLSLHALGLAALSAVSTGYLLRKYRRGAAVKSPRADN